MPTPTSLCCSITVEQLAQIDAIIAQTGQTRSEWLQALVDETLRYTASNFAFAPKAEDQVADTKIDRRPASVSSSIVRDVQDVEDEPDEILYAFLDPQDSSANQTQSRQGERFLAGTDSYAPANIYDVEDEPDEVLYDFLDEADRPF